MPYYFSSRTRQKGNKIYDSVYFIAFIYCFFEFLTYSFKQYDFDACFMYKNVHANHAIWPNFWKTTSVSEMVTGLYAMKLPRAFVISFAVAMRFFPTAKEETSHVRDAMSIRGLGISLHNLRYRPRLIFEGFIIPLLVRASTIAEELSAASITRGLDNPAPRTAFVKLKIRTKDTLVTFIFAGILIFVMVLRIFFGR